MVDRRLRRRPGLRMCEGIVAELATDGVISLAIGVLTYLHFHDRGLPAGPLVDAAETSKEPAKPLNKLTWIRLGVVFALALIYMRIVRSLPLGRRRTYVSLFVLTLGGCIAMAYLVITGGSPDWTRAAQALQGVVLLVLFLTLLGSTAEHISFRRRPSNRPVRGTVGRPADVFARSPSSAMGWCAERRCDSRCRMDEAGQGGANPT
jgi:hypothetical protein